MFYAIAVIYYNSSALFSVNKKKIYIDSKILVTGLTTRSFADLQLKLNCAFSVKVVGYIYQLNAFAPWGLFNQQRLCEPVVSLGHC